jgi:hypothetical protein
MIYYYFSKIYYTLDAVKTCLKSILDISKKPVLNQNRTYIWSRRDYTLFRLLHLIISRRQRFIISVSSDSTLQRICILLSILWNTCFPSLVQVIWLYFTVDLGIIIIIIFVIELVIKI